jgi:hypothetical protein
MSYKVASFFFELRETPNPISIEMGVMKQTSTIRSAQYRFNQLPTPPRSYSIQSKNCGGGGRTSKLQPDTGALTGSQKPPSSHGQKLIQSKTN